MPNTNCPGARGCWAHLAAQDRVRSTAWQAYSGVHGHGGHSSKTIAMSDPSVRWIAMLSFGPMNIFVPSTCDWNQTPSCVICRSFARLNT